MSIIVTILHKRVLNLIRTIFYFRIFSFSAAWWFIWSYAPVYSDLIKVHRANINNFVLVASTRFILRHTPLYQIIYMIKIFELWLLNLSVYCAYVACILVKYNIRRHKAENLNTNINFVDIILTLQVLCVYALLYVYRISNYTYNSISDIIPYFIIWNEFNKSGNYTLIEY